MIGLTMLSYSHTEKLRSDSMNSEQQAKHDKLVDEITAAEQEVEYYSLRNTLGISLEDRLALNRGYETAVTRRMLARNRLDKFRKELLDG